jgi:hypothetical protein
LSFPVGTIFHKNKFNKNIWDEGFKECLDWNFFFLNNLLPPVINDHNNKPKERIRKIIPEIDFTSTFNKVANV